MPSRAQLVQILDGFAHEWIEERLYELARIRHGKCIIGIEDVYYEADQAYGRAYEDGGDCHPTVAWVNAGVDELLSSEAAHESWMEQQRIEAEKERQRQEGLRALAAQRTEEHEREQLRKLKAKYETTTSK
jgi:hypothetical protein